MKEKDIRIDLVNSNSHAMKFMCRSAIPIGDRAKNHPRLGSKLV